MFSQNILLTWLKNVPDVSLNIFLALRHVTTSRQKIYSFVATNTTWNCPKVLSKIYSFVGTNTAPKKSWYVLKNVCFWGVSTKTAAKCSCHIYPILLPLTWLENLVKNIHKFQAYKCWNTILNSDLWLRCNNTIPPYETDKFKHIHCLDKTF